MGKKSGQTDSIIQWIQRAGELGLLGVNAPQAYGGLGLNITSAMLLSEGLSRSSFQLSINAHTCSGVMPILYFGTPEQKQRWLPLLVNGQVIAASYGGLSGSGSHSEALAAGIIAVKSYNGDHYVLNGSKHPMTNADITDLFIIYAVIDCSQVSAFLVERNTPGLSVESDHMYLKDVQIPSDQLLGEQPVMGRKMAIHLANYNRLRLAAGCLGGMKEVIQRTTSYANQRKQLGRPISSFPIVAAKLAEMNMLAYVAESMLYRTAGVIDESLGQATPEEGLSVNSVDWSPDPEGLLITEIMSDYALECAINKVFLSEALDAVVDEGIQIYRGSSDVPEVRMERLYQDARNNRIAEGTNEINRLFIPTSLLKKALKGEIPLIEKAMDVHNDLLNPSPLTSVAKAPLQKQIALTTALKKVFLMLGGLALQKHGLRLEREQEIVASLADAMIDLYALESAVLRTRKLLAQATHSQSIQNPLDLSSLFAELTFERAWLRGRTLLAALETGENLRVQLSILMRLLRFEPADLTLLRKRIASRVITTECYALL